MPRSFNWHNTTQFLGAMNDNIFQFFLIFFLTALLGADKKEQINSYAGMIFVIPFLAITPFAGVLADRFSKRNIIVITKVAELAIMLLGWLVFTFSGSLGGYAAGAVYAVLFLMCTQSSFFGPCKYSIIPELVEKEKLSKANSFLQGMSYFAIICGTALAPFVTDALGGRIALASILCVFVSVAGVFASIRIHRLQPVKQEKKISPFFLKNIWDALYQIRRDRFLIMAVLASSYFLLIGGFAKIVLIPYGMEYCAFTVTKSGYLFVVAALGIGFGAYLAGRLSGRNVEIGIIPIGAVGLAVTAIGLGLTGLWVEHGSGLIRVLTYVLIALFGLSAGLFIVPINAFIQLRAPGHVRGRVLASSSFLGWIGVLSAAVLYNYLCGTLDVPLGLLFLVMGTTTLVLAIGTIIILPDFLVRLILILLTRTIYRIRTQGVENVPAEGPALIVSNHVSWADAVVLMATQQRRIRFVMDRAISQNPWIGWIFRLGQVIPISGTDSPKKIVKALKEARKAMDDGYLVCIFAEGTLTRTGMLNKFRGGFEKITKGTDYQIIPTYIGGLWGSILSHYHGKILGALPRKLPYPVGIHFGEPMPADASAQNLRLRIEELAVDFYNAKKQKRLSLGERFVKSARRHWFKPCMSDTMGKKLSFGKTLIASVALADKLKSQTADQKAVGIFLPSSVGGALANLGTSLLGKTAVNLSYTASIEDRAYMIDTAEVKTVLTSRKFLEKLDLDEATLPGVVFMEDILPQATSADKRRALLKALLMPKKRLACRPKHFSTDDTAVILFSSGSSGRPKGVELSHHNIQSNLEGALSIFQVFKDDRLCGVLPLFHAFGLSCTLWLPLIAGVGVSFCPNPLDAKAVGRLCGKDKCSLLFATPTFLQNYLRRCEPEDFAAMRFIIAGAEKLKSELVDAFEEKFGLRPYEGYGATECSPLIALNVPNRQMRVRQQVGCKEGTVGHTVPGLAVKVLDTQTGEPVQTGEQGLLYVKGPNVMSGYLKLPEKTAEVMADGWYNTGDIVSIDADGFVTIRDRLSRFSKIGGEMVPHMTIEETVLKGLGTAEPVVAVTSLPDEKKGEQLVILYDKTKVDHDALHYVLAESGLPKLYIPKKDNLIAVDEIPHLGSGKLDMMKLKQIAKEAVNNKTTESTE
jgi:acyl-[acyl-carrier-protein]-phospholipid O-acyltransferase/long-chain-fatty-acid--[acyl-carrier-protein] ligase